MEQHDIEEDKFGFSRNYFLANELGNSGKKSSRMLADIDVVDEQELREALAHLPNISNFQTGVRRKLGL
ncbi:unnamed protein product [Coffea canephora]|uniref:DH200=94 genomic scaffold, scaffold_67 n=1 Tax=Coffea canephora TaxID=49390 RepID=A0A068UW61_COFCA|nr:unnamed protein product [Coffea canephora]